jgi:integrase
MATTPKVRERGDSFQVDFVLPNGERYRKSHMSRAAADTDAARVKGLQTLEECREVPTQGWTLLDALAALLEGQWASLRVPRGNLQTIREAAEIIGVRKAITDIDQQDIDQLVRAYRAAGNVHGTITRKLACMSVLLRFAAKRGYPTKPLELPRFKPSPNRLRWLTEEEEKMMLEKAVEQGSPDLADFLAVKIDLGCRKGELLKVTPSDINWEKRTVTFWLTKNGKPRTIPMTQRTVSILKRLCEGRKAAMPVFNIGLHALFDKFDRVREALKHDLPDHKKIVIHTCRHTCASRLVQRGVPIVVVKDWLGHSDISITMMYAHLAPTSLDQAVAALEKRD